MFDDQESPPREWWGDIISTLDGGRTSVIEASREKPKCWDEDPGDFHVIEYAAYQRSVERFNNLKAIADKISDMLFETEKERDFWKKRDLSRDGLAQDRAAHSQTVIALTEERDVWKKRASFYKCCALTGEVPKEGSEP